MIRNKVLLCDCGFEVRAGNEREFIAQAQHHALEAHGMQLSPDDVLRLAVRAKPGGLGDGLAEDVSRPGGEIST